jgi:hypothetical protein
VTESQRTEGPAGAEQRALDSGGSPGGSLGDSPGGSLGDSPGGSLDAAAGEPAVEPAPLEPLAWSSARIVLGGLVLWAVALVLTLAVPALHTGDRDWWPWCCVAGLALGSLGYAYMRRGRGNAAGAL